MPVVLGFEDELGGAQKGHEGMARNKLGSEVGEGFKVPRGAECWLSRESASRRH